MANRDLWRWVRVQHLVASTAQTRAIASDWFFGPAPTPAPTPAPSSDVNYLITIARRLHRGR